MNEAYVYIAYGDKYLQEAIHLVKSIKIFDKHRHHILISNLVDDTFDNCINIDTEFVNENNTHNKYCVIARLVTPKYITYDRFMMLDTDMLCLNNPEYVWNIFKSNDNCFNCIGGRDGSKWHWGHIDNINSQLQMNLQPMHGGVLYFNTLSSHYNVYIKTLQYALDNYDKLGFKRQFRNNAMTDEIIISYANYKHNIKPFDFVTYPVVSFCMDITHNVSKNIVYWDKSNIYNTTSPTIFNHFTGLNESSSIVRLYVQWLSKLKLA